MPAFCIVVVPGQFRAGTTASPTTGVERLYSSLQFEVYYAPFNATDFIPPSIWQVSASPAGGVKFKIMVTDNSGSVSRVVVLYRAPTSTTWSKAELTYSATTSLATGTVTGLTSDTIEYFVQAVDPTGNVALVLDHGAPFQAQTKAKVYLPTIRR